MPTPRGTAALLPVAIALATPPAAADVLTPTLGEPLTEVSHKVDVAIADGVAVYKVQRVFANAGAGADEAGLEIDLPPGAAATGLRIRARERWYDAELMSAEKAAAMYQELTGMGAHQAKDPALLQWVWADKLYLQVFPVLPGATSTVEYTLTVPTRYVGGQVFVSYPRLGATAAADAPARGGRPLATPILTVHPAWADATTRIVIDGTRVVADAPVVLTPPATPAWLAALTPDPAASYVGSELVVPEVAATRGTVQRVALTLAIDHTYKSDVRVDLVTPAGDAVAVFGGEGGDANDIRGTFDLALPRATPAAGTWRLIVSDHVARDAGTLEGWSLALGGKQPYRAEATDTPVFIPDAPETAADAGLATIAIAPPPIDTVAARLGTVTASAEHAFARFEVDVAPTLSKLPVRAQVVFVLDLSHSQGDAGIAAQLAILRAYASHLPDAAIELVGYRRTAARVFGDFVPVAELPERLAAATAAGAFAPGNGSALDAGARVAVQALAKRTGPTRIVVLTDELLRPAFTPALALAELEGAPARTVVHVVAPALDGDSVPTMSRDDDAVLADLADAHHGIFARVRGLPAQTDKALADAVLGLVRPIRIDQVAVRGLDLSDEAPPESLGEGAGLRAMVSLPRAATPPAKVVLTGKLWGDGYRKVVTPSDAFSRATAAFVFSEDEHHDLSDAEMMRVALRGRAVSPVTSYLATEPGVRPSTIGIPGRSGMGAGYGGRAPNLAIGRVEKRTPPDLGRLLARSVEVCLAEKAPAANWSVTLDVDTTLDEVVDVLASGTPAMAACIEEAAWAVRLTGAFTRAHEHFRLELREPSH